MKSPALIPLFVALAGCAAAACASAPPLHQAAASPQGEVLPVFAVEQSHPTVAEAMGAVKSSACLAENQAATVGAALDGLRSRAAARGAEALIDYRYTIRAGSPRATQCTHFVEAEAEAVVFDHKSHA